MSYDDVLHHFTQRIKEVLKCKSEQAKTLAKSMVNACKVAFPVITTDLLGINWLYAKFKFCICDIFATYSAILYGQNYLFQFSSHAYTIEIT